MPSTFPTPPYHVSLHRPLNMAIFNTTGIADFPLSDDGTYQWTNSSFDLSSEDNGDIDLVLFKRSLQRLYTYFLPLILLIGLAGNVLSITVFVCTYLRRSSCNIYLAALSVSDTVFILCVFLSWGDRVYHMNGWCQTLVYLTYVTSFLSVWYIVTFTVERLILVGFPGLRVRVCTPRRATNAVSLLALFAFVIYLFSPFMSGVIQFNGTPICAPLPGFSRAAWIINNTDTLITFIIPTTIILGCNIRIAQLVCTFYRRKENQQTDDIWKWDFTSQKSQKNKRSTCGNVLPLPKGKANYQMRATRMLLIVSSVFLLCNLPSHTIRAYAFIMTLVDANYQPGQEFILWQQLFQILYYLNFCVDFFLYTFSSRNFRLGLRRLCFKVGRRLKNTILRQKSESSIDIHIIYKDDKKRVIIQEPLLQSSCPVDRGHGVANTVSG